MNQKALQRGHQFPVSPEDSLIGGLNPRKQTDCWVEEGKALKAQRNRRCQGSRTGRMQMESGHPTCPKALNNISITDWKDKQPGPQMTKRYSDY